VTVKKGQTDSLDIAVPDEGCFAQIDLYRGAVKFDGNPAANDGLVHGDLPKGPDHTVIKDKLIAAWNGGTKDCTTTESAAPVAVRPRVGPAVGPGVHPAGLRVLDPDAERLRVDVHSDPVRLRVDRHPGGALAQRRRR
jgi:hypothetical protein